MNANRLEQAACIQIRTVKALSAVPAAMPGRAEEPVGSQTASTKAPGAKKAAAKKSVGGEKSQQTLLIPVPKQSDVDEVTFSPERGLEHRLNDTDTLISAFEQAVGANGKLLAKAIELTEERCAVERQAAVEAATMAAIVATEARMKAEQRAAINEAITVVEAQARARQAHAVTEAVADAVARTEERCNELQRVAVQAAIVKTQRELGNSEEEILSKKAHATFQDAATAAGAALENARRMQTSLADEGAGAANARKGGGSAEGVAESGGGGLSFF